MQKSHLALSPEAVRQAARKTALDAIEVQKGEFRQLGIMADWDSPGATYRTLGASPAVHRDGQPEGKLISTHGQTGTLRLDSSRFFGKCCKEVGRLLLDTLLASDKLTSSRPLQA
jgi:hypothetical protein